jgi:hypothetical protein
MASTDALLNVHMFIDKMKKEQPEQLTKYNHFNELTSKQLESNLSMSDILKNEPLKQTYIHGNIFEYAVQKAAGLTNKKNDPWIEFRKLFPTMKEEKQKQYKTFMCKAGRVAWDMFSTNANTVYGCENKNSCYLFEHTIENNTLPILTRTLKPDLFVSSLHNIVCEIKYSNVVKAWYEKEYLVHAIVQVLIYSLALQLDPSTLQLRVLVFFSQTKEAVLYESDIHKNETLVKRLLNKLRGINEVAEESDVRKDKNPKESEKASTVKKGRNLTDSEEESTDDDKTTKSLDVDHG